MNRSVDFEVPFSTLFETNSTSPASWEEAAEKMNEEEAVSFNGEKNACKYTRPSGRKRELLYRKRLKNRIDAETSGRYGGFVTKFKFCPCDDGAIRIVCHSGSRRVLKRRFNRRLRHQYDAIPCSKGNKYKLFDKRNFDRWADY